MLQQIVLGSVLVMVTTAVHSGCTAGVVLTLRRAHADRWAFQSVGITTCLVALLVLVLFLAALLESTIWAAVYVRVGAIPDFETALYFSTVTFTTLGYGDVTLDASWRLLASFEAANGTIMFGWTTALVVAFVHRLAAQHASAAGPSR